MSELSIEFKPRALRDLRAINTQDQKRIILKIEALRDNLGGDVKKLNNFTPEYRMRVGNYRVLFEAEGDRVVIYRIKHRKDAYN